MNVLRFVHCSITNKAKYEKSAFKPCGKVDFSEQFDIHRILDWMRKRETDHYAIRFGNIVIFSKYNFGFYFKSATEIPMKQIYIDHKYFGTITSPYIMI